MKAIFIVLITVLASLTFSQTSNRVPNPKYDKWQSPSYFRGYNILYESSHTLQDFIDFKNYGGNLLMIGTRGFVREDYPYDTIQANIQGTDLLVNYCRQEGIYYTIAVRSGPGAYDTYQETSGLTPESRIWNTSNTSEQQLYANMLKMIVRRYANDTLFAGINLVVEPRPKVMYIPANNSNLYKVFLETVYNIHMDRVYTLLVNQVRSADLYLPIILESFAYSTAELFPPYTINNTYLVYSAHNYQPVEFSKAQTPFTVSYPGIYWNITTLSQVLYDSAFIRNTVLKRITDFKQSAQVPVFLGEFGMFLPQNGGEQYLKDMLSACKENGIHFALWDWRRGSGQNWNVEAFSDTGHLHWKNVLSCFNAPPVPNQIAPIGDVELTGMVPDFNWDSLTSYTSYDLYLTDAANSTAITFSDLSNSHWTYSGPVLQEGTTYYWKVRSKNPGGMPENSSAWSVEQSFRTPGVLSAQSNSQLPKSFALHQNFPNPFNPETHIKFELPKALYVNIDLYDITGRLVKNIYSATSNAGYYDIPFDGSALALGIYIYRISAGIFTDTKKMILLK